jgi:hypothetical protein
MAEEADSAARALARLANRRILEVGRRFRRAGGTDTKIAFFCECGCLRPVELTVAEYERLAGRPLLHPGHGVSPAPTRGG